jgi:beta-mannanase
MAPNRPANRVAKPDPRLLAGIVVALVLALLIALALRPGGADAAASDGTHRISDGRSLGGGLHRGAAETTIGKKSAGRTSSCTAQRRTVRAGTGWNRRRKAKAARASCAGSTSTSAAPVEPNVDPTSLYWGAWIGNQLTGSEAPWDMSAVSKFESQTGKPVSLIHFASPFSDCSSGTCSFYNFPTTPMNSIRAHGSIPFFSWSSQSTPSSLSEPDYQLSDVISGRYDTYIRKFAEEAKAWGHPFFLRFDWEMNGNWFPWAEGVNGNNPGEYVAAWRHVHDIFTQVGATNATWVWCPNVDPNHEFTDVGEYYPGNEYVDWTGLDGYNWGGSRWKSFDETFSSTYHRIVDQVAPGKPMVIAEVGSAENGGSKSAWIAEMLKKLPTSYQGIRAVMWFDKLEEGDWPIESSASAQSAFASGISSASYLPNSYGNLGSGTVPVPG